MVTVADHRTWKLRTSDACVRIALESELRQRYISGRTKFSGTSANKPIAGNERTKTSIPGSAKR